MYFTNTNLPTLKIFIWESVRQKLREYSPLFHQNLLITARYYQPNPSAPAPFTVVSSLNDPDFVTSCAGQSGRCANAWGLRIVNSNNVLIYAAGLYSFFNNNDATVCPAAGTSNCQNNIFSLEGSLSNINLYNLGTVGSVNMITLQGSSLALYSDNENVYPGVIALFQLSGSASSGGNAPVTLITAQSIQSTPAATTLQRVTSTAPYQPGWSFLGCYTDNVYGRALLHGLQVPGGHSAMTIELCEATCKANGYILAGLEYSGECCMTPHLASLSI
jgi:glucan 1,3-beta-glucosidase